MSRGDVSTTGILNAVVPHLRQAGAAATAILLLTSLPFRLLEIHFIGLLMRLRGDAPRYGNLLMAVSTLTVAAFFLALYGRAAFIRACHARPLTWRQLLRVDLRSFLPYVYVASVIQLALVMFAPTVIGIPLAVMLGGVAAAASADGPPAGVIAPFRALGPYLRPGQVLTGISGVFGIALIAVGINVMLLGQALVWAAGALPGFDALKWGMAVTESSRARLAVIAVSIAVLEPFFLTAMHVFADRVRSRGSGDDLIRRFRALTAGKHAAAAVLLMFLSAPVVHGQERTIPAGEYVQQLRVVRDALGAGRFAAAEAAAKIDATVSIARGNTRFAPDTVLLREAREAAAKSSADLVLIGRLSATIAALDGDTLAAPAPPANRDLLERVRDRQRVDDLPAGGTLEFPLASPAIADEIVRMVVRIIEWLAESLESLFDWIMKLWPDSAEGEDEGGFLGVPFVVWSVTLFIVAAMLLLATYVIRRTRRGRQIPMQSAEVAPAARDADPLSRESSEWERYASDLAAGGRFREAIRAWYHAVLVRLYRTGTLHYRKGVTNWEYVSALSPSHHWRPHFITMTRNFDREWYGRHETTPDALDALRTDARAILDALSGGGR